MRNEGSDRISDVLKHVYRTSVMAAGLLVAFSFSAVRGGGQEDDAVAGGSLQTMPIFDPRLDTEEVRYSLIDNSVIVEGDIDLGTVEDVLRNSWMLAIATARKARGSDILARLRGEERAAIELLASRRPGDLNTGDRDGAESQIRDAVAALRPLRKLRNDNDKGTRAQAAVIYAGAAEETRWANGKIPYVIDQAFNAADRAKQRGCIAAAIKHWNDRTVIQLVAVTENDAKESPSYVRFRPAPSGLGICRSAIGRQPSGGEQRISLSPVCRTPQIIHEIGHTVGLFHEHSRNDSDLHIEFRTENMKPHGTPQFNKMGDKGEDVGEFDFESIMLYPYKAFTANGQPTIVRKSDTKNTNWGLESGPQGGCTTQLSAGDIAAVQLMYQKKQD